MSRKNNKPQPRPDGKLFATIYARYSSDGQREESIEGQLRECKEYAERPEGIILESLLEGISEYYSAELSVKVRRGQMENALKGKANGGMIPFGYKVNADRYYEIDPLTAPLVLEIFTRYADGQTVKEIGEAMNSRGVFTNMKHKYMNKSSVHKILKNRRYMGEYRYGSTVIPDTMPRIVPQDIFDKVQERMEKNKHKPAAKKAEDEYILTTKLFCGRCGVMMVGTGGTSKTGKVHHYYKCGNALYKKSCDKKAVKKDWIERLVVTLTRQHILVDDVIARLANAIIELQKQENTVLPFLQKQLADVGKRIANLINSIEEGIATASVKQRLDDLEGKKADLEICIAREKIEKPPLSKKQIIFWINKFKDGDIDDLTYRQAIVDIFVNSVFLYDDDLTITYNWKDDTKTVTLAELEAASGNATGGETLKSSEFSGSYLDDNAPIKMGLCPKPRRYSGNESRFHCASRCCAGRNRGSSCKYFTPEQCDKSELMPVGDGFGFICFVRWQKY